MDTEACVRELLKLIFGKKPTIPEAMVARSCIPSDMLSEDFSKKMKDVLHLRKILINHRWQDYFSDKFYYMSFSHRNYIYFAMFTCLYENICNENIFDGFISVCTLLKLISNIVVQRTWVDFSDLNPDIFIIFYRNALQSSFRKRKDFYRLLYYIRDHKYHKWNSEDYPDESYLTNMEEELNSYDVFENVSYDTNYALQVEAAKLASEVLKTTSAELPDLPSMSELKERLAAFRKGGKENKAEKKTKDEITLTLETSHGGSSLNSDYETDFGEHQKNIARYESIIDAVIKYNHSKNSGNETANNQIDIKTNGVLEHLDRKINFLIEVLDKCGE